MKTGNTPARKSTCSAVGTPQWSPVMKTGNTVQPLDPLIEIAQPQWSPVMKTGNTGTVMADFAQDLLASMEPGHEDREYFQGDTNHHRMRKMPQWSPVMKTGNTGTINGVLGRHS